MVLLRKVQLNKDINENFYPFNLPLIRNFTEFSFGHPVTILVGENGTGKSTFLEAVAAGSGSILIGGEPIETDPSLEDARKLADKLKLIWSVRTKNGFFFRANDFINYSRRLAEIKAESRQAVKDIRARDPFSLEVLPYARTVYELEQLYGDGLDVRSHGESFLDLFQARFRPDGLYILDEPEAPLSPLKQLSLISLIMEMVKDNCQFIIATHSPMLMAIPGAVIYTLDEGIFAKTDYSDVEHVRLTKNFLDDPRRFLRHL
ncbi:AAA family ATPase [Bacillus sp. B-jedd]|uniref:AAA family ATPase n=1 Tax=Bacillus sp. B-jedd TaxID=1476857 RepID=UPI00051566C5|nr:AAA family ATPase [Bacillus sp. B-jedd]CEG29190.1 ABC transporter [Bacillus sp. B-jedd]